MAASREGSRESSQKGAWLSIATYVLMTAAKLLAGYVTGSQAIVADGVNNATDVLGSVAVLIGLKIARRPADAEHRYGHERAEGVASLVVATIMGLVSLDVGLAAIRTILNPPDRPPESWALPFSLAAAAVMLAVYFYNRSLARRTGSTALEAAAHDHLSDALISLGAAVGILGARIGFPWADPLAGLVVAVLVARTAWRIGREASLMLMDGFTDTERVRAMQRRIVEVEGVKDVRSLRCRMLGSSLAVDVTVAVPAHMSVSEAHEVADRVEAVLSSHGDVQHVLVHVEPEHGSETGAVLN